MAQDKDKDVKHLISQNKKINPYAPRLFICYIWGLQSHKFLYETVSHLIYEQLTIGPFLVSCFFVQCLHNKTDPILASLVTWV